MSACPRSASVSLPASPGSEHRFLPAASHGSFPSALEDDAPVPSSSCGRFPAPPDCVSPLSARAAGSRPQPPLPSASRTSLSVERFANSGMVSPPSARHGCTVSACRHSRFGHRSCGFQDSSPHLSPVSSSFSSSVLWFFSPSLHRHYSGFFATSASADFFRALTPKISPGKVQNLSPRAVWLYWMRLDDFWALPLPAGLPPASSLTASSCSYGREFATRFFQLHLTATPCVSLRLPSSAPVGSFHPTRFCPCWAHWRTLSACHVPTHGGAFPKVPTWHAENMLVNRDRDDGRGSLVSQHLLS